MDAIIQALRQSGFIGGSAGAATTDASDLGEVYNDTMRIMALTRAYMSHGHLSAKVDPLELDEAFAEMDLGKKYGHTA
jgi:2-oxoglutarate dehydrogenase complex dehydrogenase (E1) component-like enzyme